MAPGRVKAWSQDAVATRDTTTGFIDVRAVRMTAGEMSGFPGDILALPMTIGDPSPFGLVSCEFQAVYDDTYLRLVNVSVKGTVAEDAGWQIPEFSTEPDLLKVSMAGAQPLAGPGTLVFVYFELLEAEYDRTVNIYPQGVIFNEAYPAAAGNGHVFVDALPGLNIYPRNVEMTVGEVLNFYVSGTHVEPLVWSVTNPAAAIIDAAGDLTALAGGTTRVRVEDAVGATGLSEPVRICDLVVSVANITFTGIEPGLIAVVPDRDMGGMDIYGMELRLSYDENRLEVLDVHSRGTATAPWGASIWNDRDGDLLIVNAGMVPLVGGEPLFLIEMQPLPYDYDRSTWVRIETLQINEGDTCALTEDGIVSLRVTSAASGGFGLSQNHPNPFNPRTTISFSLESGGPTWLRVFTLEGKLVRTLIAGEHRRDGAYTIEWDGRDSDGKRIASGTYICRLESGGRSSAQRMLLVR